MDNIPKDIKTSIRTLTALRAERKIIEAAEKSIKNKVKKYMMEGNMEDITLITGHRATLSSYDRGYWDEEKLAKKLEIDKKELKSLYKTFKKVYSLRCEGP